MSIDVIAAAQHRSFSVNYRNRAWLASELGGLIAQGAWSVLGGLALHVALAAAPLVGDLAAHLATAAALAPRTAAPAWSDPAWVAGELAAHVAALVALGSDLQAQALRMAGACARVAILP